MGSGWTVLALLSTDVPVLVDGCACRLVLPEELVSPAAGVEGDCCMTGPAESVVGLAAVCA